MSIQANHCEYKLPGTKWLQGFDVDFGKINGVQTNQMEKHLLNLKLEVVSEPLSDYKKDKHIGEAEGLKDLTILLTNAVKAVTPKTSGYPTK